MFTMPCTAKLQLDVQEAYCSLYHSPTWLPYLVCKTQEHWFLTCRRVQSIKGENISRKTRYNRIDFERKGAYDVFCLPSQLVDGFPVQRPGWYSQSTPSTAGWMLLLKEASSLRGNSAASPHDLSPTQRISFPFRRPLSPFRLMYCLCQLYLISQHIYCFNYPPGPPILE